MKILWLLVCLKIVFSTSEAQSIEELKETFSKITPPQGEDLGDVTVNTILGSITGKKIEDEDGDEIHMFLGIPYAQPPVGDLRFLPPRPVMKYDNLEAMEYGPSCPQFDFFNNFGFIGEEDCLSLNLFVKSTNTTFLKPVMVFIHGGSFAFGSGSFYNPAPLIKEDVIVVTVNYRLAVLGFMTMGNDLAPGNLGLRDQIQALQWIRVMIAYFGGNPSQVTVFGESAGGMSSHALTLSPKAMGLISGAIYQSGTMLISDEDYEYNKPERTAAAVGEYFNCSSTSYDMELLNCLQSVDVQDLLQATMEGAGVIPHIGRFYPNIDTYSRDPVNPENYLSAMKNGHFSKIPIMTGTLLNDGGLYLPEDDYEKTWNETGSRILYIQSSSNTSENTEDEILEARIIKRFYTGENAGGLRGHFLKFIDMLTDAYFLSPDQKVAELASKYVPVYNFRITHKGKVSTVPFNIIGKEDWFDEDGIESMKPTHSDDLYYTFAISDLTNEEDKKLSKVMVKYWTNFAKYGHPSPLMTDNITQWLPYSSEKNYIDLKPEPEMKKDVEKDRMTFWQRIHWSERERKIEENQSMLMAPLYYIMSYVRGY